jgi:hypothetical protein
VELLSGLAFVSLPCASTGAERLVVGRLDEVGRWSLLYELEEAGDGFLAAYEVALSLAVVSLAVVSLAVVSLAVVSLAVVSLAVVSLAVVSLAVVSLAVVSLAVVSLAVVSLAVVSLAVVSLVAVSLVADGLPGRDFVLVGIGIEDFIDNIKRIS